MASNYLDAARAFIARSRWQYAKTMRHIPHEYTVRDWHKTAGTEPDFDVFVLAIRDHGYQEYFGKPENNRLMTYLAVGEHRYWTMRKPDESLEEWLSETTIINRCEIAEDGKPKYGPQWLTGRKREASGSCCALGRATGGKHHAVDCPQAVLTLDV
jgi:hypothetical protein